MIKTRHVQICQQGTNCPAGFANESESFSRLLPSERALMPKFDWTHPSRTRGGDAGGEGMTVLSVVIIQLQRCTQVVQIVLTMQIAGAVTLTGDGSILELHSRCAISG
jgi:hypothetical protein